MRGGPCHAARLREDQQVVGDLREVAGRLEHVGEQFLPISGCLILRDRHLQRTLQRRQGAAKLVGRVGHELLLLVDVARDRVEQSVDGLREQVEFVAIATDWQPVPQPRGPEPLGGVEDVGQRSGGPPRQPEGRQRCQHGEREADREQDAEEPREILLEQGREHADADVVGGPPGPLDPQPHVAVRPHLHDVFLAVEVRRRKRCDRSGAVIALPDGAALFGKELHEPATLLVALGLAPHLCHHRRLVGVEFADGEGDLPGGGPKLEVGVGVDRPSGREPHGQERHRRDQEHDGRVPDRQSRAERGAAKAVNHP